MGGKNRRQTTREPPKESADNRPARDLEIIIPAYNEAGRLPATLEAVQVKLAHLGLDSAIVVVDNGSVDRTISGALNVPGDAPIYVLGCDEQGKGAAVRRGVLTSRAGIVGYQDADLSTSLDALDPILAALGEGADVAIAVRRGAGASDGGRSASRTLGSRMFSLMAGHLTGVDDSQCGFKFFRIAAARALFSHAQIDGFAFDVEVLARARRMGLNVATVPVSWTDADGSTFRAVQDGARSFLDVLRINRDILRERGVRHPPPSLDGLGVVFLNWRDPAHPQAGGAEQYAWELARRIAAGGARTTYLTAAAGDAPRREMVDGVAVVRRGTALSVYPAALAWLARHRRAIDVVVDCQNGIPFFSPLAVGKHRAVVLVVHHVHQDQFATRFSPAMAAVGRALEGPVSRFVYRGHTIVAVSPSTRHGVRRRLRFGGPVVIVPNGTPVALGSQLARAEAPTVLFLGRLVPHKRVDLLLRAAVPLSHRWPDLRVAIVGDGPCRPELEALAHEIGLDGTVRFYGRVDERTKADLMASAWLAVHPSMAEGWGIAVMEAAAMGVPSLAFDVAGLRDSVLDGETGWLVPEGSDLTTPLQQALTALAVPASAKRWGQQARAWAECFSWDDSADRLSGLMLDELRLRQRAAGDLPERRRTDEACVLEIEGLGPDQVDALRAALRRSDVVAIDGDRARALLYGCDERSGRFVAERVGLTGHVHVRAAQQRDLLTVRYEPPPTRLLGCAEVQRAGGEHWPAPSWQRKAKLAAEAGLRSALPGLAGGRTERAAAEPRRRPARSSH
jgi:glycosyltransferase involved in cell wall biosynthesis